VVRRGGSRSPNSWAVRYRERVNGKVRHRNIYLGDRPLARLAKALIQQWRDEATTPEERRRRQLLRLYDVTASARGYSKRARKRLREAAIKSLDNPTEALKFAVGLREDHPEIRYGRRPGRPARSGLW
jgi:hypothetical protein